MNRTTTIHFVQDNQLTSNQSNAAYNWSNVDNNLSMPIQQIHYVESNFTLINNSTSTKSMSLIQMNPTIESNSASITNNQTQSISTNEEMTYLTPLINVKLGEPVNGQINKLLPITIADYNQQVINYENSNSNNSLATLPSMAASFGSPIVQSNCTNVNNLNNNSHHHLTPAKSIKAKHAKANASTSSSNWMNCSKPGRKPAKLNEQKLKFTNEFNLSNLSKVIKKENKQTNKQRKQLRLSTANLIDQTTMKNSAINLSNAPNNLCNLNSSLCSPSLLNNSTNSIDSLNSMSSTNSNGNCTRTRTKCLERPDSVNRRNLRERQRVTQLNLGYQRLKEKIPHSSKKLSKAQTLRRATQYIKYLQQQLMNIDNQANSFEFKNQIGNFKTDHLNNKTVKNAADSSLVIQQIGYYELDTY